MTHRVTLPHNVAAAAAAAACPAPALVPVLAD